jgi:DNA-binding NtrC family response regulator
MNTILLIEDGLESSPTADLLSRSGYRVIATDGGSSALSLLQKGASVDLIIIDYAASGPASLELLHSLKKIAPAVPSILLASNPSIEIYLKALSLGVFEYFNTPAKTDELLRTIRLALGKGDFSHSKIRATPDVL